MKNKLMIAAGVACAVAAGREQYRRAGAGLPGARYTRGAVCILRRDAVRPDGDAAGPGA